MNTDQPASIPIMASNRNRRAVFLDRDGVLNRCISRPHTELGSPRHLDELVILPGVDEAIDQIHSAGLLAIVVTNQPEISRGLLSVEDLCAIHDCIKSRLPIDDIFVCFHDDADGCDCRKPKPGMILEAAGKWGIRLEGSYMVGDRAKDVEAGQNAGVTSILIEEVPQNSTTGTLLAQDLISSVGLILALESSRERRASNV